MQSTFRNSEMIPTAMATILRSDLNNINFTTIAEYLKMVSINLFFQTKYKIERILKDAKDKIPEHTLTSLYDALKYKNLDDSNIVAPNVYFYNMAIREALKDGHFVPAGDAISWTNEWHSFLTDENKAEIISLIKTHLKYSTSLHRFSITHWEEVIKILQNN